MLKLILFNRFAHSAGPDCMAVCLQALGNCELVLGNALGSWTVLGRYLGRWTLAFLSLSITQKCVVMFVCVCFVVRVVCVSAFSVAERSQFFRCG